MTKLIKFFFILLLLLVPLHLHAETLYLVTALDPMETMEYVSAFEKDTGIKVEWIRLSTGETLARLKSEARHPTQDVWFGAPAAEFIAAKQLGLLAPYFPTKARIVSPKWRDKDGYWTGIYFGTITFVSGKGVRPPTSWQELLDPIYKGEIVVSYPYTAGTGYTVLSGLTAIMGEDAALDYYEKLDKQIKRYTKAGSSPVIEVGLGEADVGIVFAHDGIRKGSSRGFPVKITYPSDGVPYEIGGVGVIKGGNEKLAAKFVDWAVSLPAQALMHKWYRVPLHPKAILNPESKRPDELSLAKMDMEKAGLQREALIQRWRERVGK